MTADRIACLPASRESTCRLGDDDSIRSKSFRRRRWWLLLYETSANSTFRQVFLDGRPLS